MRGEERAGFFSFFKPFLHLGPTVGGGKKELEAEDQRSRPPESPRREGKRREDEDYFVVEASSNVSRTEKDQDFPG